LKKKNQAQAYMALVSMIGKIRQTVQLTYSTGIKRGRNKYMYERLEIKCFFFFVQIIEPRSTGDPIARG
jgi:hypothetical protein